MKKKMNFKLLILLQFLLLLCIHCAEDGADGLPGDAGAPGEDGTDGADGADGQDAATTGTISGTVLDEGGNPVEDVEITTVPTTELVTSDASGEFELVDVPVGAYLVEATLAGVGSASIVTGVAGGSTTNISLTLVQSDDAPATIEGSVVDSDGSAVEGASVTVEGQTASATTAADGSFALSGVEPGYAFLNVAAPFDTFLDGGLRKAVLVESGETLDGVQIVLSGRPTDTASWVGESSCATCHAGMHMDILDGTAASIHARFVTEGTDHMVYPELWPEPGDKFLPRDPSGLLLMAQDPSDGEGLVNLVLCTEDTGSGRDYLFKFYPQQPDETSLTEGELDCSPAPVDAVWIPVAGTIGGEGNWGEGYLDPDHAVDDTHPNFGEGKQRFLAKIEDVPYLVDFYTANGIPVTRDKQDYVAYMPVYIYQDATPVGSPLLSPADVGGPKFWQKAPDHWCVPTNTLSRNCAGCHNTGLQIAYEDVVDGATTHKAVVTEYDYQDLNVTCERCHGPGSDHAATGDVTKIINPRYLTARSANETCGQCHAAHAGKSQYPMGVFKYAFDEANIDTLGNGVFVPGVYDMEDFYFNYNEPTANDLWSEGSFHTWPDGTHGRAHSQQLPEMLRSVHANNSREKLTCASCHNPHSLAGAPDKMEVENYEFGSTSYADNTMCLACHAENGPFAETSLHDVAALQIHAGRTVTVSDVEPVFTAMEMSQARNRVANNVADHMQAKAGMGLALYTPGSEESQVGRCTSCHMPKIGKLKDLNDDAQYHLDWDAFGMSAVAEGNVGSHVFDIVWPAQSSLLLSSDPSTGHDYDIMPNSCGSCHEDSRLSGDLD